MCLDIEPFKRYKINIHSFNRSAHVYSINLDIPDYSLIAIDYMLRNVLSIISSFKHTSLCGKY